MQNARLALSTHTVHLASPTDFNGWRAAARRLALNEVPPEEVAWEVAEAQIIHGSGDLSITPSPSRVEALDTSRSVPGGEDGSQAGRPSSPLLRGRGVEPKARRRGGLEPSEDSGSPDEPLPAIPPGAILKVPREFVDRAETVFCHSDPDRFAFLYRMLWRLRGEPNLLKIASDVDVRRFETMEKAIHRDIHKMRAFVRFRKIGDADDEEYVAWFEPDHHIVERNADFFVRRFTGMRWTILTPYASASWDTVTLTIGPGASRRDAPAEDATEELWRTYFRNIFNPARLKVKAMQAEMPKKYWKNLPEADLIPDLIANAEGAAREMIARMPTTPAPHHAKVQAKHWPGRAETDVAFEGGADAKTVEGARDAAKSCRRCPLWRDATQTVFGEGPDDASVVFVGEQPGDQEDLAGKPFVGPAGKVFDAILEEAEVDRDKVYVTNAVKHFKFEPRGKRRIHAKPNAGEVQACRWWIDKELSLIKPNLVVALGATAALSLLGKAIAVTKMRGQVIEREDGLRVFLTIHPSFILRIPDPADKEVERARFRDDMRAVKKLMAA